MEENNNITNYSVEENLYNAGFKKIWPNDKKINISITTNRDRIIIHKLPRIWLKFFFNWNSYMDKTYKNRYFFYSDEDVNKKLTLIQGNIKKDYDDCSFDLIEADSDVLYHYTNNQYYRAIKSIFFKEKGKIIYLLVDNKFISNGKKRALEEAKKEQSANNLLSMLD